MVNIKIFFNRSKAGDNLTPSPLDPQLVQALYRFVDEVTNKNISGFGNKY